MLGFLCFCNSAVPRHEPQLELCFPVPGQSVFKAIRRNKSRLGALRTVQAQRSRARAASRVRKLSGRIGRIEDQIFDNRVIAGVEIAHFGATNFGAQGAVPHTVWDPCGCQ